MTLVEMKVPAIGESITEVTLSQWLIEDGAMVKIDEPICEFESDKATLEFPAEASGKLIWVASEGDDLEIGALVARIDTSASDNVSAKNTDTSTVVKKVNQGKKQSADSAHTSPLAAKMIAEHRIPSGVIKGTGKNDRITKADVETYLKKHDTPSRVATEGLSSSNQKAEEASVTNAGGRNERKEKMTRMRRTIAKRLVAAKNETAMLTTFNEVDLTNIIKLRKKYQEEFVNKYGVKLGFMSIFSKACAQVLMEMPQVNARLDGEHMIYHDYVDISIAISTDTGLVVPPVHNVESLGFHEIELKIKELAVKAREGSLSLKEMTGGTFTITNGGIFGSMMSTPILNQPQSAILGMHSIMQRPVAIDGQVQIRPMMYLALSYDHRVIDGSSSVTFLVKVIELLEDPVRMMIHV